MRQQAELIGKLRACATLIAEVADLQSKYQELLSQQGEVTSTRLELRCKSQELRRQTGAIDALLAAVRVRHDATFIALQQGQLACSPDNNEGPLVAGPETIANSIQGAFNDHHTTQR